MSVDDEYTEDEKRKAFSDCFNFVSSKQKEAEAAKKKFDDTFKKWKSTRQETIREMGKVAERIKELNDEMTPAQTIFKGVGIAGKIAVFGGPVAALTGAAVAIAADVGYGACAARKVAELEKLCDKVQRTLETDTTETERLCRLTNEMRTISEAVKECVRKFHSATVKGFFDSVSVFQPFATSVRKISSVDGWGDIEKFLAVLWDEAKNLAKDPVFKRSFSALTTYNPAVMELIITVPEIILGCSVFYSAFNGMRAGAGALAVRGALKGLTVVAIIVDFEDIVKQLSRFNEYPKLSKELFEIKRKLEHERDKIYELATEMSKKSTM